MSIKTGIVSAQKLQKILLLVFSVVFMPCAFPDNTLDDRSTSTNPAVAKLGADGIQRLEITLDSYTFSPTNIIVQSGIPVEFQLKNVAIIAPHNFRIDASADGLVLEKEVAPGKSATLSFLPDKSGIYEFYCDKKLLFFSSHRDKGMVGKLYVK